MLVRMLESLPPGMRIEIQLMRDDEFREPLTKPVTAMVVRNILHDDGFVEHGVQVIQQRIRRPEGKALRKTPWTPRLRRRERPRMHTRHLRAAGTKPRGRE